MIYGIGTDIVVISRIRTLTARWGDRLPRRVLGPDEWVEYQRRRSRGSAGEDRAVRYLAKRFAAKEAFSKAIGLGLRGPMTLQSLQVLNDPQGRPVAHPRRALADWMQARGLIAQVSISDETDAALAFVVVEHQPASEPRP